MLVKGWSRSRVVILPWRRGGLALLQSRSIAAVTRLNSKLVIEKQISGSAARIDSARPEVLVGKRPTIIVSLSVPLHATINCISVTWVGRQGLPGVVHNLTALRQTPTLMLVKLDRIFQRKIMSGFPSGIWTDSFICCPFVIANSGYQLDSSSDSTADDIVVETFNFYL